MLCRLFGVGVPKIKPPAEDPFYHDRPSNFAALSNGAILRWREVDVVYFPGFDDPPLKAWHVAYKSKSQDGMTPQVTVTTVFKPSNAVPDKDGDYRVLSYLSKTDSAAPNCRTSYALRAGNDYRLGALSEQVFMEPCLDRGWILAVPDYQGETDAFGAGAQSAYATLDGIRAVLAFDQLGLSIRPDGSVNAKLAMWGYSGGALAGGWAAQLQPSYAPELKILGTSIGGLPSDLTAIAERVNKTIAAGLIIGVMQGLANAYPELQEWLDANANDTGRKALSDAKKTCFGSVMSSNFSKDVLGSYFDPAVGSPLTQQLPQQILADNRLGNNGQTPLMPMHIYHSLNDEVVPIKVNDNLVTAWASNGATIDYTRDTASEHVVLSFTGCAAAIDWIQARFDGAALTASPGKPNVRTVFTTLDNEDAAKIREYNSLLCPFVLLGD